MQWPFCVSIYLTKLSDEPVSSFKPSKLNCIHLIGIVCPLNIHKHTAEWMSNAKAVQSIEHVNSLLKHSHTLIATILSAWFNYFF